MSDLNEMAGSHQRAKFEELMAGYKGVDVATIRAHRIGERYDEPKLNAAWYWFIEGATVQQAWANDNLLVLP
ncbi:hypothetical protein G3V96_22860 [Escherichia coli]|nr:hypothetical protein [Escherichia coli]